MEKSYEIFSGPSREELFDALRLRYKKFRVSFGLKVTEGPNIIIPHTDLAVNSIEVEDGSGDSWNIKLQNFNSPLLPSFLKGTYNTRTRAGRLEECTPHFQHS